MFNISSNLYQKSNFYIFSNTYFVFDFLRLVGSTKLNISYKKTLLILQFFMYFNYA